MQRDVVIIGGGIAGLATAWHLARRGDARVVLLEREPELGRHSSGRSAAILRTLGADARLGRIARAAAAFLRRPPPGFAPGPLLEPCGLLLVGSEAQLAALPWREHAAAGERVQALDAAALRARAPHYAGPATHGLLFPDEGRIEVGPLVAALAEGARRAGARLETGAEVLHLETDPAGLRRVRLADGRALAADAVVIAAGGWAERLGRDAGSSVALRPTRRHLLVAGGRGSSGGVDPRWPVLWQLGDEFYCRPEGGGLLSCACDVQPVDPDRCDVDPAVRGAIASKAAVLVPSLARLPEQRFWSGVRTLTADGRFAVGPDPDVAGLCWVAGLGGWGMTTGVEVGRLAAALVSGERIDEELRAALDPARLRRPAART